MLPRGALGQADKNEFQRLFKLRLRRLASLATHPKSNRCAAIIPGTIADAVALVLRLAWRVGGSGGAVYGELGAVGIERQR